MKTTGFAAFSAFILVALITGYHAAVMNQYTATNITQKANGISAIVTYTGSDTFYVKPNNTIIKTLNLTVTFDTDTECHIKLQDINNSRFELPSAFPYPFEKGNGTIRVRVYSVTIQASPFALIVKRRTTGEEIFNTNNFNFMYSEYYLEFGTQLPTWYIYGIGERASSFKLINGSKTIIPRDAFASEDTGRPGGNSYGQHPMYLMKEKQGPNNWHVVFLRSSNPMDVDIFSDQENPRLVYKVIGSIIDLKFFFSDSGPEKAIRQYHTYVGGYIVMPFW